MSASYLLDEDPGEDKEPTEFDFQRGRKDEGEASIVHLVEDGSGPDENLRNLKPVANVPSEYVFVDFPSSARFVAVNAPSLVHRPTSRTLLLPCATAICGKAQIPTNLKELRSLTLAASESIGKPSSKKPMAITVPAAAARRCKRKTENKKEHTAIAGGEDLVNRQAQSKRGSVVTETCGSPLRATRSATVLGQLSEKTLNKLHAFKFTPPVGYASPPGKTLDHRPEHDTLVGEDLTYLQPDVPTAGDDDGYDEFDLDEDIFDNIYADDDAEYRTSDSTTLDIDGSSIDPCPDDPESPQGISPKEPPPPHPTPPKPTQTRLVPMSPFLRPNFPQPAPPQSILPSLVPHRRIPTLFRIAEVYRFLATLSPRAPPQRIELYATIASSRRTSHTETQEFTFADLFFPHRPPYLCGAYTAWRLCELFEEDSAPFLETAGGSKLCRAIVRVTRNANTRHGRSSPLPAPGWSQGGGKEADGLDVEVLNIWEATWEDVGYVKGIVGA